MRVVGKNFKRHRIAVFVGFVAVDVELDELVVGERFAGDRVRAVLLEPWDDVREFENVARDGTDRMCEGLERERADVEGKAFERERGFRLVAVGSAVGVGGRPFGVGDVEPVVFWRWSARI